MARTMGRDSSVVDESVPRGTTRRVLSYARPYRGTIAVFLVIVTLAALTSVAAPLALKTVVDDGVIPGDRRVVVLTALAVAAIAVAEAVLTLVQRWYSARIGEGLILDLRSQVFRHVQEQPIAFFTRAQTGSLVTRLNTDVIGAQAAFSSVLSGAVSNTISVALVLAAMFALSWQITLVSLLLVPLFVLAARWMGQRLAGLTREQMTMNADMGSRMTERFNVGGAMLVKLFGDPDRESAEYTRRAARVRDLGIALAVNRTFFMAALTLVAALATAIVYGLGGILADDMGLGKTVQTLAMICRAFELHDAAAAEGGARPRFLVVAPTSVAPNWAREIERFAPHLSCAVLTSSSAKAKSSVPERAAGADVVVTSYALLRLDAEEYADLGLSGLVLDEAQFLKNPRTKAHRIARDLPVPFKLVVTGTPMENDLMELWAMFSIVAPGLFPSARDFRDMYAKPISSGEDPQALPRLRRRIRPLMLRRSKELVAADLPEKQEHRVDIALTPEHRRIYETRLQRERQKILGLLQDMDRNRFTIFQSLTMLRRLALSASLVDEAHVGVESAKLTWLTEQLPEIIADGHRALVFSQFTTFLHQIAEALEAVAGQIATAAK